MAKPSRRDFLKIGAAAMGSTALSGLLAACGKTPPPPPPPPAPSVAPISPTSHTVIATDTAGAAATQPAATSTPPNLPDIVVARNGAPEDLVSFVFG